MRKILYALHFSKKGYSITPLFWKCPLKKESCGIMGSRERCQYLEAISPFYDIQDYSEILECSCPNSMEFIKE